MSEIQQYPATKHPDSDLDYGRNWADITHEVTTILTTTVTAPDGTKTETEEIVITTVVDQKGWLNDEEIIIESTWEITSDTEKVPTLVESAGGTGIGNQGTATSIFLKGGTPGVAYKLTNHIKTFDTSNDVYRIESKVGLITCCRN